MKRSGPIQRKTALKSGSPLRSTRHRKQWAHLRDETYKAFVREQGCMLRNAVATDGRRHVCQGRVEFAHLENEGTGHADYGNGIGLCTSAHRTGAKSMHVMGKRSFPEFWQINLEAAADTLVWLYQGGEWE